MAKILTSFSPKFAPVLKELAVDDQNEIVTTHQPFAQTLANLDIKAQPLVTAATNDMRAEATKQAGRIIADLHRFRFNKANGLMPAVKDFLKEDLAGFVYGELADAALFVLTLDAYRPDIIILHNDVEPLYRAAAFWCRENGIPCLHIPHAIYQDIENKYDIHRVVTATHLASAGKYQSSWYVDCGMAAENIYETGLPQFDEFANLILDKQRCKKALGLPPDKPVIMYASSWRQDTNLLGMHDGVSETYAAILECAKLMPDVHFLVKTHPHGNNARQHLEEAKKAEAKVTVTPHHLPQCLQASDLLFAYGPSNILLEGAHIPWLRLACSSGYQQDAEIYKIATDPPKVDLMIQAFYEILRRPVFDTTHLRIKYLGICDGQNSKRVAMVIKKLVEELNG